MTRSFNSRGFTVIELIVTAVIGVLVAGATVTALSSLLRVRSHASDKQEAMARADAVAGQIALDLAAAARDYDLAYCKVELVSGGAPGQELDELTTLCTSLRRVHGSNDGPEGQVYETQYRLTAGVLWRRTDAGLDPYLDAGGIAAPIARGIRSLSLQAYDGTTWFDDWNSDTSGLPHAVRATVLAASDDGKSQATARRIIALDRVPVMPEAPAESATTPATTPSTTGGAR